MKQSQIIKKIAKELKINQKNIRKVFMLLEKIITEELQKEQKVYLKNIGRFEIFHRYARNGWNPDKQKPMPIPEVLLIKFRPSLTLKHKVRKYEKNN